MGERCPFCLIVTGRTPASVIREWPDAVAIEPLNPVVRGHVLVIPRRHVVSFFSDPEISATTMRRAAEMLHGVELHHEPRDHNIITSAGPAATQTVMHLHVHIVPREHGDGLPLPWTPQRTEDVSKRLAAALTNALAYVTNERTQHQGMAALNAYEEVRRG